VQDNLAAVCCLDFFMANEHLTAHLTAMLLHRVLQAAHHAMLTYLAQTW
jgi:hypothetical protein